MTHNSVDEDLKYQLYSLWFTFDPFAYMIKVISLLLRVAGVALVAKAVTHKRFSVLYLQLTMEANYPA